MEWESKIDSEIFFFLKYVIKKIITKLNYPHAFEKHEGSMEGNTKEVTEFQRKT